MPGAEATTTTAELDPRQAGDWSLGAGIWGEYQNSITRDIKECKRSSEFNLLYTSLYIAVLDAQTLLLENWKHGYHTDAMPGAEATTTTAELDPRQAGHWSRGVSIGRSYMNIYDTL